MCTRWKELGLSPWNRSGSLLQVRRTPATLNNTPGVLFFRGEAMPGFRATVNQTADFAFKTHLAEVWSGRFVRVQQCGDAFGCVGYGG